MGIVRVFDCSDCSIELLFGRGRLHAGRARNGHRPAVEVDDRHLRIVDRLAATVEVAPKEIRRVVEDEEALDFVE